MFTLLNSHWSSISHYALRIRLVKASLNVTGEGQFYKEKRAVYRSVFNRQWSWLWEMAEPQSDSSWKFNQRFPCKHSENVTLCLHGWDLNNWLWCVCTRNMIQNQFRGTVMRTHKSWSSQECQTGQNKKLDFGLWCRTGRSLCLCLPCNTDHIRSIQMNLFLIILFRLFLISAQLIGIYTLLYTDWFGSSQYEPVNNASQLIVCSNRDLIF